MSVFLPNPFPNFIKWPGNKQAELQMPEVRDKFPASFENYYEPFLGSGSVYYSLSFEKAFVNDVSQELITVYRAVSSQTQEFFEHLTKINQIWKTSITPGQTYIELRKKYNNLADNLQKAAHFVFLRQFCYSGMFRYNQNQEFNASYGGDSYSNKTLDTKIQQWKDPNLLQHMSKTGFSAVDFETLFSENTPTEKDFVFLDPPYDDSHNSYTKTLFTDSDQKRLRDLLLCLPCQFLLIIKDTPLIRDLYADSKLNTFSYEKRYKINFRNRNHQTVTHLLIRNFET